MAVGRSHSKRRRPAACGSEAAAETTTGRGLATLIVPGRRMDRDRASSRVRQRTRRGARETGRRALPLAPASGVAPSAGRGSARRRVRALHASEDVAVRSSAAEDGRELANCTTSRGAIFLQRRRRREALDVKQLDNGSWLGQADPRCGWNSRRCRGRTSSIS